MTRVNRRAVLSASAVWAATLAVRLPHARLIRAQSAAYDILDLGPLGSEEPWSFEVPYGATLMAVNSDGVMCGMVSQLSDDVEGPEAAYWGTDGTLIRLPGGSGGCRAADINRAGLIVGAALDSDGRHEAAMWVEGELVILPTDGDDPVEWSQAYAVNDDGVIVGVASSSMAGDGPSWPLLWRDNEVEALPMPRGFNQVSADVISSSGRVAGVARVFEEVDDPVKIVVWEDGELTELDPPLDGMGPFDSLSCNAVTSDGRVLVTASAGSGRLSAFIYEYSAATRLESPVEDAEQVIGLAMNESGTVVGIMIEEMDDLPIAVLWEDGEPVILDDLIDGDSGFRLTEAVDINDDGVIATNAYYEGDLHGVLLIPAES